MKMTKPKAHTRLKIKMKPFGKSLKFLSQFTIARVQNFETNLDVR